MKIVKSFATTLLVLSLSSIVSAQHNHAIKTETLKVSGKCQMCKARIEKIASENGAASAEWDIKAQLLTIVFDPSVTSVSTINYKLLKAGHDSGGVRAKDKAYNALPDCCKYDRLIVK